MNGKWVSEAMRLAREAAANYNDKLYRGDPFAALSSHLSKPPECRMLTEVEVYTGQPAPGMSVEGIQRKFAEVNGLTLAAAEETTDQLIARLVKKYGLDDDTQEKEKT